MTALPETHLVTADNGPRPNGPPDQCAYCRMPIGADHDIECVLRRRLVMVRVTVDVPMEVAESHDAEHIEFWLNDGTRCADNTFDYLAELFGDDGEVISDRPCSCPITEHKVIDEHVPAWLLELWREQTAKTKAET